MSGTEESWRAAREDGVGEVGSETGVALYVTILMVCGKDFWLSVELLFRVLFVGGNGAPRMVDG